MRLRHILSLNFVPPASERGARYQRSFGTAKAADFLSLSADLISICKPHGPLEGVFLATRYPFERGIDITRFNLESLMGLADFLDRFARSVPPTDRIEWK